MYSVNNKIAYINGEEGKYDGIVKNSSVRYGRNSASSHYAYLADYTPQTDEFVNVKAKPLQKRFKKGLEENFDETLAELNSKIDNLDEYMKSLPPVQFNRTYLPYSGGLEGCHSKDNKQALIADSYEEMGQQTRIKTQELTRQMQNAFGNKVSAEALDINKDGNIDLAEYSCSVLVSDYLSSDSNPDNKKRIDGVITNNGENAALAYASKKNYNVAYETYKSLYENYDLKNAQDEFLNDPNNTLISKTAPLS